MELSCAVPTCTSKEGEARFYRFPAGEKNRGQLAEWIALCGNVSLLEEKPGVIYSRRRICMLHFCKEDFYGDRLKRGAKPKLNLPDHWKNISEGIDLSENIHTPQKITAQQQLDFWKPSYTEVDTPNINPGGTFTENIQFLTHSIAVQQQLHYWKPSCTEVITPDSNPGERFRDFPPTFTEEIFIKEETDDIKDQVKISFHLKNNDDQNISKTTPNSSYHNIGIKQENALEEDESIITTSVTDIFTPFKDGNEVSANKTTQADSVLNGKKMNIKTKIKLLDDPVDRSKCRKKLPFKCDVCNLRFFTKRILTEHRLVHFQRDEFECDKYGARFTYGKKRKEQKVLRTSKRLRSRCKHFGTF